MELLSPAGSFQALIGAVNAGADAVYFGGDKFSARAFADNLTLEETHDALRYAHMNGVRCYLTLNTLIREDELDEVIPFLAPYVQEGIDAVLVQDQGALGLIREAYPGLSLHASTQMALTGVYGARLLKEMGAERIVPARECGLSELARIRKEADIEVEAFVHGAMCYCYSGLCLFSGMIGGRSGNRGRCAQACRLPYAAAGEKKTAESYPLSMKDLCTLEDIPALAAAGVDALKIEGRMKRPAYAAGVTAIYRKYIDRYEADPAHYSVDPADLKELSGLYLRTEVSDGYLHKHNGREMVTQGLPGYLKTDDDLLKAIEDKYLQGYRRCRVTMHCHLQAGQRAYLTVTAGDVTVTVTGEEVQQAKTKALSEADVRKQLEKVHDTPLLVTSVTVEGLNSRPFLAVSALNALRRAACDEMVKALALKGRKT